MRMRSEGAIRIRPEKLGLRSYINKHTSNATKRRSRNLRYIYDDDDDSRRGSVASNLAEDGDNASSSSNLSIGRFVCGICDPICFAHDDDFPDNRDLAQVDERKKEVDNSKRMMMPSMVEVGGWYASAFLSSQSPPSPRIQPPSPRTEMQIDLKRQESRNTLIKRAENELVQADTRDEQDRERREKGYNQHEPDDICFNLMQCSNVCISWNNCEEDIREDSDNVSDITTPTELPWNDDYHRGMEIPIVSTEPLSKQSYVGVRLTPTRKRCAGDSISPSRKSSADAKTLSNITTSSNSRSSRMLYRLPSSPLLTRSNQVRAKKVKDVNGTVLYEI